MGMGDFSRRDFMTTAAAAACSALLPTTSTTGSFQGTVVDAVKKNRGLSIAREFPLRCGLSFETGSARRRAVQGCHGSGPALSPFPAA
jgi:hypothetical protein